MDRLPLPRIPLLLATLMIGLTVLSGCAAGDPNISGARQAMSAGDFDRALGLTETALQEDPDNAQIYHLRGDIYLAMAERASGDQRGAYVEAMVAEYARARELNPADGLVEVKLLQAYNDAMQRGATHYGEGTQDPSAFGRAARAFQQAGAIMPDSAIAHLYHGISYLQTGDTDAAAQPLQAAVDAGTEEPEAYVYLGQIYLSQDRADDAITVLENARTRFPENAAVQSELLNAYARTGQTERALTAYAQAVDDQPDDAIIRYNYGSFLLQAGRYDEAIEHLTRATELDPERGDAYYNLGAAYMNQAVALRDEWAELDDQTTPEAQQLQTRRDDLLRDAVGPLERARTIFASDGIDPAEVCNSLFQAYALLRMDAEARDAAQCAGIDLD